MILEDDLYVSPDYYNYAMQTLEKYGDHPKIAGISLNTKRELLESPYPFFHAIQDMMCIFSSCVFLGTGMEPENVDDFRKWYDEHPTLPEM